MRTSALFLSCAMLVALATTAEARPFRILKGQQRDITRFQRAIVRSDLHPRVKQKVMKSIARAKKAVVNSKAPYQRVHTSVSRYGGTMVFQNKWGRETTLRYNANGKSKARDIAIFNNSARSSWTFRAKALSPQLTLSYRGRLKGGHANPTRWTSSFRMYTSSRQRSTGVSEKLGTTLLNGGFSPRTRSLVAQLEPVMARSNPKGLSLRYYSKQVPQPAITVKEPRIITTTKAPASASWIPR